MRRQQGQVDSMRWVPFRNDSGEEIPAFAVMRITGIELVGRSNVIKVEKPNNLANRDLLVNGPTKVADGEFGSGTMDFPAFVLYDTADGTPVFGESWGVKNATWKLSKDRPGFRIMGGEIAGETNSRVVTTFEGVNKLLVKTDASHAKAASGTCSIYKGTQGSEADTTDNLTAWNKFAALATTKWAWAEWLGDGWYLTAGEC